MRRQWRLCPVCDRNHKSRRRDWYCGVRCKREVDALIDREILTTDRSFHDWARLLNRVIAMRLGIPRHLMNRLENN